MLRETKDSAIAGVLVLDIKAFEAFISPLEKYTTFEIVRLKPDVSVNLIIFYITLSLEIIIGSEQTMKIKFNIIIIIIVTILLLLHSIIIFKNNNEYLYNNNTKIIEKNDGRIGGLTEHHIYLRPGETRRTEYILYTGNETGSIKFIIYRVSKVGDTRKIVMPNGLNVSISPSGVKLKPRRKYTFDVIIKTSENLRGTYTFLIRACLENGKKIDDWLRILVAQNPNPGFASFYLPRFEHIESITLKAGEKTEVNYTLYTGESPPGTVRLFIYRVKDIYKRKEIPMPRGLNVSIVPSERLVRPHSTYVFKIRIKTDRSLPAGKYVLCIKISGSIGTGWSWLTINVR